MPPYAGNGTATLLYENRQLFLFQRELSLAGVASIAVQPERSRNSLPAGASFQIYFTDVNGNPANPGAFEIDLQDSDIDADQQYCSFVAFTGELNPSYAGRAEIPALYGKYVRVFVKALTNPVYTTVYITNFNGVGGGVVVSTNPLPDAPQDGNLYGREDGNWVAAVPIAGGTMTGPLILSEDPVQPLQAATMEYVDSFVSQATRVLSGIVTFAGVIDGANGECTFYGPLAGTPSGPLPAAGASNNNFYLICDEAGTIPSGPLAGTAINLGDWALSTNSTWVVIPFGVPAGMTAAEVAVNPTVLGASDVQTALQNFSTGFLPLTGGTMTGNLTFASGLNLFINGGTINAGGLIVGTSGINSSGQIVATAGINCTGNIVFGNTNQSYLQWQNNTNSASGPNVVLRAGDANNRLLWDIDAQQSGNIVGGNPEGTFHLYTMDGGYGRHHTFWTIVSSPTQVQSEGAMNAPAFNVTSDRSLKKNIREAEENEHCEAFAALKPVRFNWATDGDKQWNRPKWGFIANDIEAGAEHVVSTSEEGLKGYDAVQVLVLAVAEIQRLNKQLARIDQPWYRRVGQAFNGKNGKATNGNGHVRETVGSRMANAFRGVLTRRKYARIQG